jgi:4'-phosphopantetheinyl transferase
MTRIRKKKLHYLVQHQLDLPPHQHWLGRQEAGVLASLDFPKRRRDWLLGRWAAKAALTRLQPAPDRPMSHWQIKADHDGAPMILQGGHKTGIPVSLSHSGSQAVCVLGGEPMQIGCDLEKVEARSRAFEETFFTDSELALLDRQADDIRPSLVTLIWSAKESALKALRLGLKADTRRVELKSFTGTNTSSWGSILVEDRQQAREFHGWWREQEQMVLTILSDLPVDPPIAL